MNGQQEHDPRPNTENITAYLRAEKRGFAERPLSDADLLACAAFAYFELEHCPKIAEDEPRLGDLGEYGPLSSFVENDCNPNGMLPLAEALVASPRFRDLRVRDFSCTVQDDPAMQFGALCLPVSDTKVVIAFRGTDMKPVGWLEDFEELCNGPTPSQERSLRYLQDAAARYPGARLYVCGHSKGGACAEYATVFADASLQARIARAVSFDGPALYRLGGDTAPELGKWDLLVQERYRMLEAPLERYVFAAMVGLMFEPPASNLSRYPFVDCVDESLPHNVCSARIVGGELVTRDPEPLELYGGLHLSRCISQLGWAERVVLPQFIVDAFYDAGLPVDLGYSTQQIARILLRRYRREPAASRDAVRSAIFKLAATR